MTLSSTAVLSSTAAAGPSALPLGLRELANKVRVYTLVRYTARGAAPRPDARWEDLVARVYRHDAFSALFRLERLGHDLAAAAWTGAEPPRDLFRGPRAAALPERSLVLLHGGMGLFFAQRIVGALRRAASDGEVGDALARFIDLCRANARAGYAPPAWETLGAIVRLYHRRRIALVGQWLGTIDSDAADYFWHGVGRATYFLPRYLLPGGARRALAACRRLPLPDDLRKDVLHGFFFATAMVNLRHPRVIERALLRGGERPEEEDVVVGGLTACLLARRHTTPDDPAIAALLAHRPAPAHAALWERRLRAPIERMLSVYYPLLAAAGEIPQLARHHHLPSAVAAMRGVPW